MGVREIKTWPEDVLRQTAAPVEAVDDDVRALIDDMVETMHVSNGVGLAAPQVGVSRRVIVVDVSPREPEQPLLTLVNPEVTRAEGELECEEGCLSLPDFLTTVRRAEELTVKAVDREGRGVTIEARGFLAVALQHEIDHLNGTLILDKANPIRRQFYKKRIKKRLAAERAG